MGTMDEQMRNRRHALTQAVRTLKDKPGTRTMDVLTLADYYARWMDRAPGAPCTTCTTCEGSQSTSSTDELCTECGGGGGRGTMDPDVWITCTGCEGTGQARRAQIPPQSTSTPSTDEYPDEDRECTACEGEGGVCVSPAVWIECTACEGNGRTGGRP